jgi:hypothetical protein
MRPAILGRLKALEAKSPNPTKPGKGLLPAWLMEKLEEQGVRFDASRLIGMESGCAPRRLGGIQDAWLKKP